MNEPAIKLEEQIISMFPEQETQICQGWILKKAGGNLCVYPLYYKFAKDDTPEKVRRCEETARRGGMRCVFRIVEHTNYYLSAVLADRGYEVSGCGVVGIYEAGVCGMAGVYEAGVCSAAGGCETEQEESRRNLNAGILILRESNLRENSKLRKIMHFPVESGNKMILADVPGQENLPEEYEQAGFRRAYGYQVYRKMDY